MADQEPLYPQQTSINMDADPFPSEIGGKKQRAAAVTDLVYFLAPTTELAIKVNAAGGRLVKRSSGRSLVQHVSLPPEHRVAYCRDFFTTIVNTRWYVIVFFFAAMYVASWLLFGGTWLAMNAAYDYGNYTCVTNVDGFSSAFLFSLETQMTIGYGYKYLANGCRFGVFLLIVQCVVGLLIDSFLLGLVFTKLSRPRNRRRTLVFSDYAVIYEGDCMFVIHRNWPETPRVIPKYAVQ